MQTHGQSQSVLMMIAIIVSHHHEREHCGPYQRHRTSLELLQLLDERQLLIQPLAVLVPMCKQRSLLHTLVHTHLFMVAQ
jgi:hypothetical protein